MGKSTVAALRLALPYLQMYDGACFVVKIGGDALLESRCLANVIDQIELLRRLGLRILLVHGLGPQATRLAAERGIESQFVNGRRITDEAMLTAMVDANRQAQSDLVSACARQQCAAEVVDAAVQVHQRPPVQVDGALVDFGHVGDVDGINRTKLEAVSESGKLPIIGPICATDSGQPLNVNADTIAAHAAIAMGAQKLILATGAPGICRDVNRPSSLLSHVTLDELAQLEAEGVLSGGMLPKHASIALALNGGVARAHVVGFSQEDSILSEIFTNEGCGTLIVRRKEDLWPSEQ